MVVYLIAGMPAAGKDTLGHIISRHTNSTIVSMSRDILIPLIEDEAFRKMVFERTNVNLSCINFTDYPLSREGLIQLGDDLNETLERLEGDYTHFCNLAYVLYGDSLVIPSFRQQRMLSYLERYRINHKKIFVECPDKIRHRRWAWRDGISTKKMRAQDKIESRKYIKPLLEEVIFDEKVDNSGSLLYLEEFTKRFAHDD